MVESFVNRTSAVSLWNVVRRGLESEPGSDRVRRAGTTLLALVLVVGISTRLYPLVAFDFPMGDGALFREFVDGIATTFPALPAFVHYNGLTIPFAYPPLSFWVGALFVKLGVPSLDVIRVLPILFNIGYVVLFAIVLLRESRSRLFTAIALIFLFATLRSSEWLVMGGGMSRGAGSLFFVGLLLAIQRPGPPMRTGLSLIQTGLAGICIAGALLSHLEWGVLSAATFVLGRALGAATLRGFVIECIAAGLVSFVLVLPWFGVVLRVHGPAPFLDAQRTGGWLLSKNLWATWRLLRSNLFPALVPIGIVVAVARRHWFWPLFSLLCLFVTPRHGLTPIALAVSIFFASGAVTLFGLARAASIRTVTALALTSLCVLVGVALQVRRDLPRYEELWPLPADVRAAMAWVAERHAGETFAVITQQPWWSDITAEWFPTIAKAVSVATVQGREWLPGGAFAVAERHNFDLEASQNCEELARSIDALPQANFVWAEAMRDCFRPPAYAVVFRNNRVTILQADRSSTRP